jgi:hypothetical protein
MAGAIFNIPPTLVLDPSLAPCALCTGNAECDDGNVCTTDVCVPATGCQHDPNTVACSDGNACTLGDVCGGGTCVPGPLRNCADTNACTLDLCNPATGLCQNPAAPGGTACNDGNACTQTDACNAFGQCLGANPVVCPTGGQCENPGVCNPGTGLCSAPVPKPATASCNDGNACTGTDRCDGAGGCQGSNPVVCVAQSQCHDVGTCNPGTGTCSNPPKPAGAPCDDDSVCTLDDACDAGSCVGAPISGCVDGDGDGVPDDEDACVTLDWFPPSVPPNQQPSKFALTLKGLAGLPGEQGLVVKGFFNPAASLLPIDPASNGVYVDVEEVGGLPVPSGGRVYGVSIPGGLIGSSACDPRDGWKTIARATTTIWKYVNRSGALPPACAPGSARGVVVAYVKDQRATRKAAYQFVLRAKRMTLDLTPRVPINRVRGAFALGAQPAPGTASPQAMAGQCAESVFEGNPIRQGLPRPFCKPAVKSTGLSTIVCKGL